MPALSSSPVSILLLCLAPACSAPVRPTPRPAVPRPAGPEVAFVDVTVVPMDTRRQLPHRTVLVRGGRIARVGAASAIRVPDGATRIDGRGKFLMPGLCDMHVHLESEADLLLLVANGVTTVRNMLGSPRHLVWRSAVASGRLLGPTIVTAGPMVDGDPPARPWPTSEVAGTPAEARRIVARQKKAGYDLIKFYSRLTPEAFDAVADAARELGIPIAGHVPWSAGLEHLLSRPMVRGSIEHMQGYVGALQSESSPYRNKPASRDDRRAFFVDPSRMAALAQSTREAGVWNCPTLVVTDKVVPKTKVAALLQRPEMRYVPELVVESWDLSKDRRYRGLTAEGFKAFRARERVNRSMVKALADAGARLLLGTDANNPFVVPGFSAHEELALLVSAGLTPYQALRTGTADAAEFLDMAGELGTVRAGARADLVLVEGNPLDDVANAARRVGVMLRGRWLPRETLQSKLRRLAASVARRDDTFAGLPPPSCSGDRLFSGRYDILWRGKAAGGQRLVICERPRGALTVAAQATDDYDRATYTLTIRRGPGRSRLELRSRRGEGAGRLELRLSGGRLKLRRELPAHAPVSSETGAPRGLLLGSEGVETFALLRERLLRLEVGRSLRVEARQVRLRAGLGAERLTLVIKRTGERRFAVAATAGGRPGARRLLTLDARGWPVALESKRGISFRRAR